MTKAELYKLAIEADDEWSGLLRFHFGKRAGDIRYTAQGKGAEGTELRAAHDEFQRATAAWREAV
jgi:hypothetical protein